MFFLLKSGCERNFFGLDCRELCSGHCNNNDQCDHISGVCPDGCQDGYMDKYCKSRKKPTSLFLKDNLHRKINSMLFSNLGGYALSPISLIFHKLL